MPAIKIVAFMPEFDLDGEWANENKNGNAVFVAVGKQKAVVLFCQGKKRKLVWSQNSGCKYSEQLNMCDMLGREMSIEKLQFCCTPRGTE